LVIAITARGEKSIGSTAAMDHTAATSPFYPAWIASVDPDLRAAQDAIAARDLTALGRVVERSALRMHASAIAADPAILYWGPATVAVLQAVAAARKSTGLAAYATIDAGPHVKVLCRAPDVAAVVDLLRATPGVLETLVASPGPDAHVIDVTTEASA
jgi:diphosphomevalonate decarboxylase